MTNESKKYRIPTERGNYYCNIWLTLYDGGSDQWLYVCRDGLAYIFIDIIDMPAACGHDADHRWYVRVCVVDLFAIPMTTVASALQSCGYEEPLDFKKEEDRLAIAEMLYSYGASGTLWEGSGGDVSFDNYGNLNESYDENCPHFRRLRKEAREFGKELLSKNDGLYRDELMNTKVVNDIGQTAQEFMIGIGGHWAALHRIKELGDRATPKQQIVLKMYQSAGTTLGAGPVPENLML